MPPPDHLLLLAATGAVSFALSYVGAAAGLILGHLRLPLLVYALGSPVAAAATNLGVSGLGAAAGAWRHVRDGRVSAHVLLLMGVPSVAGSVLAVLFFVSVPPLWSHLAIGAMLLASGVALLRGRDAPDDGTGGLPARWVLPAEIAFGLVLGAMAAATGLMLGTMRLPVLIRLLKVDPKVAVGSNMVVGCLTAFAAAATAWARGGVLDPLALLVVGPPTVLGSLLGARLTGRISKRALTGLVGWAVAASGLIMVGQVGQREARRFFSPADRPPPAATPFDPAEETPDPREDADGTPPEPHAEPQGPAAAEGGPGQ